MSDLLNKPPPSTCDQPTCSSIKLIIQAKQKDLGGFSVRRLLPFSQQPMVGPWIFFDHLGPAEFGPGDGINVRPHPHINLATVTYLFEGKIHHRDSLGSDQLIEPGDINLMVAGSGIVHSERQTANMTQTPHRLHALQLWLALPEEHEEMAPAFYHYDHTNIPSTTKDSVAIRVLIGSAFGLTSPCQTYSDTLYVEAAMPANSHLRLPSAQQKAVYVVAGSIEIDAEVISEHHMAVLANDNDPIVNTKQAATIVIIGGAMLSKRHIYWNFVSSSRQRIEQAKDDWQHHRFAVVPGDESERIALP